MKRLALAAVGLALVVGAAAVVAAVWASIGEAPWEESASSGATPTPESLDNQMTMTEVARRFLYAWKAVDLGAMKALMAEDGTILVSGTGMASTYRFPLSEWADMSDEQLCGAEQRYDYRRFPCEAYEVANEVVTNRVCHAPTPAQAANGYGMKCMYWLAYAWRTQSDNPYQDGASCVEVRVKDSVPKVTYAEDGSLCWH